MESWVLLLQGWKRMLKSIMASAQRERRGPHVPHLIITSQLVCE